MKQLDSVQIGRVKKAGQNSGSLVDAVYETLLEAIIFGKIPGGTIVSELSLSKKLDVSRTPVHEAVSKLVKDGLVERQHGRRARIVEFTGDDLYEIFEMRKLLEGAAAELAAARIDMRQLTPLRMHSEELHADFEADDWLRKWVIFDETFHRTIADACGNRRLARDIHRYHLLHRAFNRMGTDVNDLKEALAEHDKVLDMLEARDPAGAREAMEEHIAHWQSYFVRSIMRGSTTKEPLPSELALSSKVVL